jgi:NAD(P) transhydrogenase subunit alpha
VKIDLGETGETDQGYAKELTEEQIKMQKELQAKVCEKSDIVITYSSTLWQTSTAA